MAAMIRFPRRHTRTSEFAGYRSGRSSCLGIPEARSTASTRKGGTSSHCDTACAVIPKDPASFVKPPAASIARRRALLLLFMGATSSIALPLSQALLHWNPKGTLYDEDMSLGNRIKLARKRLGLTQGAVGNKFGITDKAVSGWERGESQPETGRLPSLAQFLKVPLAWLLNGEGDPPPADDLQVRIEALTADQAKIIETMINAFLKQGGTT